MSLAKKNLEHPVLVLIVFAIFGMLGIFTLSNLAIALMPETENPYLSINTSYSNAGPEAVEKSVTKLIESAVMSVNGLKEITSTSQSIRGKYLCYSKRVQVIWFSRKAGLIKRFIYKKLPGLLYLFTFIRGKVIVTREEFINKL